VAEEERLTEGQALTIERTYRAPAQRVFDAFTSEEVMRRWWHPAPDWDTPEASVDLRIGGRIRVVMRDPETDRRYGGGGEYTEIDPPNRLVFTWVWEDDRDHTGQLIEVGFHEHEGVTTVRFTHSNLWDEEAVSSHRDGWNAAFDNLARTVER
jgi:uncharacterized protein YndB with AHSA1/START domain